MTPPVRITDPAPLLALDELRQQCRVDGEEEDALLLSLHDAAVAHLDGWRGVLGRAIMPQQWQQDFTGWGVLRLALPDVTAATVTWFDAEGEEHPAEDDEIGADALGSFVRASGPAAQRVRVVYDCALPEVERNAVKQVVRLMVSHWFDDRPGAGAVPMWVGALIAPLRRVRV